MAERVTLDPAVERAHQELWRRFVDHERGFIHDFAGLGGGVDLPSAEESVLGRPNAFAWGCPNEDGALLGGDYLDAQLNRWKLTGSDEDAVKARRLADGLMTLATCGRTPGFIARGLSDDGTAHHPIGSNDQTTPWLYGLWRYLQSGLPDATEYDRVKAQWIAVGEALRATEWRIPCDAEPFDWRGYFARFHWESAPRLLFLCRAMAELTGSDEWLERYHRFRDEPNPKGGPNRLDICANGMIFWYAPKHSWTCSCEVSACRVLSELETDPAVKERYLDGLRQTAALSAESLSLAFEFDPADNSYFELDWRRMSETWRPQTSVADVVELAQAQLRELSQRSPRRVLECELVREPLFAAWNLTHCPDRAVLAEHAELILEVLRHYPYDRLYLSQFLMGEAAYYELKLAGVV